MSSNIAVKRKSLAEEVASHLRGRIISGEIKVGEKLPAEGELSTFYGVGRSTIREAVKALANSGLLRVKQGLGTFVESQYAVNEPISQRLKRAPSGDLDEIRQILEMKIAEKAAVKRTKSDIEKIAVCLAEIDKANQSGSLENSIDADIMFHMALAEAAHNQLLLEFYQMASEHLRKWYSKIYSSSEVFATAFVLHKKLSDVIAAGDSKAAWKVAEEIIRHGRV